MNVAHIDELDAIEMSEGFVWRPVRRRFDIRAFGVNVYTPGATKQVVETHTERQLEHREIYLVLRGRVQFSVGEEEHELSQGQLIYVSDPALRRGAVALTDDAAVIAFGGKPGEAFEVSAWETMFAAVPYMQSEDWDEAIRLHEEALAVQPNSAPLLYNLACMECRAGRSLDALLHLQEAVAREPEWAKYAQTDSDFAAIRTEQGFPAA
jgi:quercetin dioxygenase-like cupin family protein